MSGYDNEIMRIRSVYREMRFLQAQRQRLDLAFQSYVRMLCGYSTHDEKEAMAESLARAQALIAGTSADDELTANVEEIRKSSIAASNVFVVAENEKVRLLEKIAKTLPIWTEWASDVRGLGAKGVGSMIGEAGDIGAYRSEAALWKCMGVGVIDGIAQGKLGNGATADDWIMHGYNRKRRSVMFTIGDAMVKQGDKYREIYLWRKEVERQKAAAMGLTVKPAAKIKARERDACISDGHIHRRAQRYMEKKLLRAIYRQWKRTMVAKTAVRQPTHDALVEAMTGRAP